MILPWILMVFVSMASSVVIRSLSTELFPTGMRGAGAAWIVSVETLGAGGGLFAYAQLETSVGDLGLSLSIVSLLGAVSCVFLLFLPDTHQRELESITED